MKYAESRPTVFHMPGHKLGKGIPCEFLKSLHLLDVTEIPGTDNLHFPQGAIKEAQELAARAFGALHTYFLVNGSTCGVHAMIMAVCRPGDKLIIARDCHKSVIGGLMLAGIEPIYIKPDYNDEFGISTSILAKDIESVLIENPDAVGVLITRPNYYGICSDINEIARVTHTYGKLLLVDEAHGSHLRFSDKLPVCALDSGADICVQSAHKTLPAFTQSAYLHVGSDRIDLDRLGFYLGMLQTSSPSYILMAFLDIARAIMENDGKQRLEVLLECIDQFGLQVKDLLDLTLLKNIHIKNGRLDRTRIVIKTSKAGLTGYEAEKVLREKYGIQVEMSDFNNLVCISSISDTGAEFERLLSALRSMLKEFRGKPLLSDINIRDMKIPEKGMSMKEILNSRGRNIPLKESAGRISLQMITPYPPGIPLICPGEIITVELIEYINGISALGASVNGLSHNQEIKVAE